MTIRLVLTKLTPGVFRRHECYLMAHKVSRDTRLISFMDHKAAPIVRSLGRINQAQQAKHSQHPEKLEETFEWKLESMSTTANKSNQPSHKRRFSDDQLKSLEATFQSESRPEVHLKQHLADKLGLQPRQVAIWFQNRRARSKSKEIEREYCILKSNYDKLASQFEALRKENQILFSQLWRLRTMADKRHEEIDNKNQNTLAASENPRFLLDVESQEPRMPLCCDLNRKDHYLDKETNVSNMDHIAEGSGNE